uniref:Protein kinase domain-containing protein n=1 Tax=Trypanosoma congolense (strain IL3000) TaxID=1068625 RepID=G0UPW6_TRYCI|nr:putative protein kinase [Trypanosoma congolense IL3000]
MASQKQRVGKYELGKVLASGYFDCRTRLCTHIVTGAQYVVRIYNKNTLAEAKWMWERIREAIHVMRTLPKHENIIEISELFETESSLYILMQLFAPMHVTKMYTTDAPTGERITVPIQRTKLLFTQVVRGLRHMHDCDVVHFGLAPDHVMVNSQDQVKIGGLVSCKYVPKGTKLCRDIRGTMHTVAPEVLRNGEYDPYLADAWSLGVLLYFMLHRGRYPHDGANTTKNILYHRIRPPDPNLPVEAQDLLRSLLSHDPTTRLRVEQIMDHPFFTMEHTDVMMTDGHLSGPQSGAPYWKVSGTLGTPAWKGTLQQRLPYSYSSEETAAYLIQQFYRAYRSHRKNRSGCTLGSSRRNSIYRGRNQVVDVVQPNFRQPRKTLSGFGFGEVDTNHLLDKASSIAPNYSQRRAMCGIPDTSVGLIPHGQGSEETIPIRCRGGSMTSECNGSTLMLSCSDSEGGILNVTQVSRMNLSTTSNATHLSVRQQGSHKLSFEVPGDNLRLTSPNPVLGATDCIADAASGSCNEGGIPLRFYARTPSINHMRGNDMHPWDGDSRGAEGLLPKIKVDPMRRCPVCNRPPPQRAIRIKPYLHTPYEYKKGVFKDKTAVVSD